MRILLFLATNIAILVVVAVVAQLLGLDGYLTAQGGINLTGLLIFSALIGFTGSFISLALSKWMAKRSTGARVIDNPSNSTESWLVETVRRHATTAGIDMPEVAIFDSPDPNAFATGARRNNALVAVSTGLMNSMQRDEVDAVLAHEVAHVANGDMVTMTLIQGVVNTFVIFLSRLVGYFVDRVLLKNDRGHGIGFFAASLVAQIVFGILASIIVMWFSRQREFRADAGGAQMAGREKMIAALQRLQAAHEPQALPDQLQAFGISGGAAKSAFSKLFLSHPPLDERIEALRSSNPVARSG